MMAIFYVVMVGTDVHARRSPQPRNVCGVWYVVQFYGFIPSLMAWHCFALFEGLTFGVKSMIGVWGGTERGREKGR